MIGVLDRDKLARRDPQPLGGEQVALRVRLGTLDEIDRDAHVEQLPHAEPLERRAHGMEA